MYFFFLSFNFAVVLLSCLFSSSSSGGLCGDVYLQLQVQANPSSWECLACFAPRVSIQAQLDTDCDEEDWWKGAQQGRLVFFSIYHCHRLCWTRMRKAMGWTAIIFWNFQILVHLSFASYLPLGGICLSLCSGSGSFAETCAHLNRSCICIEADGISISIRNLL